MKVDVNNIDLNDTKDQTYYTTRDIVIPAGSRIENWSNEQKQDGNRFEMVVAFNSDVAIPFRLKPHELEEIMICDPQMLTEDSPEVGFMTLMEEAISIMSSIQKSRKSGCSYALLPRDVSQKTIGHFIKKGYLIKEMYHEESGCNRKIIKCNKQ